MGIYIPRTPATTGYTFLVAHDTTRDTVKGKQPKCLYHNTRVNWLAQSCSVCSLFSPAPLASIPSFATHSQDIWHTMLVQTLLAAAASLSISAVQATAVQHNHVKRGAEPAYVGAAPGTYTYIGCYVNNATVSAPNAVPGVFQYGAATLETCAYSCYGHDNAADGKMWQYFAVQGQNVSASSAILMYLDTDVYQCQCDGLFNTPVMLPESACNYTCPGNANEYCGGYDESAPTGHNAAEGHGTAANVYQLNGQPDSNAQAAEPASYTTGYSGWTSPGTVTSTSSLLGPATGYTSVIPAQGLQSGSVLVGLPLVQSRPRPLFWAQRPHIRLCTLPKGQRAAKS